MSVSIIGVDESIIHLAYSVIKSKRYYLKNIMINKVDYKRLKGNRVLFLDNKLSNEIKEELYLFCLDNNISIRTLPDIFDISKKHRERHRDHLVYKMSNYQLTAFQRFNKRLMDIVLSVLIIILLSPLMLVIVLMIKLLDRGPALYYQKRLTYQGKTFILLKFRTMVCNAEKKSGAVLSEVNDNRITKVGRFLRKTRLDEIPQIFNVLSGEMSLVGPRPERDYFVQQFKKENKFYRLRFNVKAGITGLAQLNCYYNSSYLDKLNYDLLYIANYSIWNDIKLLIQTIKILFNKVAARGTSVEKLEDLMKKKKMQIVEVEKGILELRQLYEKNHH